MPVILDFQNELVSTVRFLHSKGWAVATSSNYSFRESGQTNFYISESGVDKGEFNRHHLIYIDAKGVPLEEPYRRVSAETDLHCTLYALFPKTQCVLHTHSILGTILSQLYRYDDEIVFKNYELLKAFEGIKTHETMVRIPIFTNTQNIHSLSDELRNYVKKYPDTRAFLIAGHGLYTWASSIAAAKRQVEAIEFLLDCEYKKRLLMKN
ncbi:MAG: hypothetical protein RI894_1181 [Bacteroidota bacterium]|jgi:methylthioribulose-1-phosphate dehydratase